MKFLRHDFSISFHQNSFGVFDPNFISRSISNFPRQLIQYLERDWSVKTEVPADPAEFIVWTFNSYDSAGKTSLQLGVRFENQNNGLTMTVYCPFWMLNKTGLNLSYRVSFAPFRYRTRFRYFHCVKHHRQQKNKKYLPFHLSQQTSFSHFVFVCFRSFSLLLETTHKKFFDK